jgi:ammonium transporter, Amt family
MYFSTSHGSSQPANKQPRDYIAHLDGFSEIAGGWLNHHYIQLAYQLADSVSGFAYSFGGTCIILFVMNLIPGLSLRSTEEDEILGIDDAEIGEFAVSLTYYYPTILG